MITSTRPGLLKSGSANESFCHFVLSIFTSLIGKAFINLGNIIASVTNDFFELGDLIVIFILYLYFFVSVEDITLISVLVLIFGSFRICAASSDMMVLQNRRWQILPEFLL